MNSDSESWISACAQSQALSLCTLIWGKEELLNLEALAALRAQAQRLGFALGTRLNIGYGAKWSELPEALQSRSLFAERRLIEVHSEEKTLGKAAVEILSGLSNRPAAETALALYLPQLERLPNAAWVQKLDVVTSQAQTGAAFVRQLKKRSAAAQLVLEPQAFARLVDYCSGNLLAAQQAIERLTLCAVQPITVAVLSEYLSDMSQVSVFAFSDAFLSGDFRHLLALTQKWAEEKTIAPAFLNWLLARDCQLLWQLQQGTEAQEAFNSAKVFSAAQKKRYHHAAQQFAPARLRALLRLAARLDRIIKGTERGDFWLCLNFGFLVLASKG